MNIYVGNLSFDTQDSDLRSAFEPFGEITTCNVIKDRMTNRSRGFGFVEMPNQEEALKAIEELDGKNLQGREIRASEAKPRENRDRDRGNSGGGFRGGNRNRTW
ncbi:MAG: RNA-binding protein [Caldisericia bacterium]|nr:RNA-binding protein [Caldisericia bacterium]MDD4614951.1 RNA-binding protein [Caldisericia bacterium]